MPRVRQGACSELFKDDYREWEHGGVGSIIGQVNSFTHPILNRSFLISNDLAYGNLCIDYKLHIPVHY